MKKWFDCISLILFLSILTGCTQAFHRSPSSPNMKNSSMNEEGLAGLETGPNGEKDFMELQETPAENENILEESPMDETTAN